MPRYDFRSPRLFIDSPLGAGATIGLERAQVNYLINVMRLKSGDRVLAFNGRDGEWHAGLLEAKRGAALQLETQTRPQPKPGNLHVLFAPLKHARLDYMVQKAVEMGASHLQPVFTRHSQVARINIERMRSNVIEAAEQCGILTLPEVSAPIDFKTMAAQRDSSRLLIFCDEDADVADPVAALSAARGAHPALALLLGPEGGFAEDEREALIKMPNVLRLSLGPRILRADTAAVAALALVQAVLGDWGGGA